MQREREEERGGQRNVIDIGQREPVCTIQMKKSSVGFETQRYMTSNSRVWGESVLQLCFCFSGCLALLRVTNPYLYRSGSVTFLSRMYLFLSQEAFTTLITEIYRSMLKKGLIREDGDEDAPPLALREPPKSKSCC